MERQMVTSLDAVRQDHLFRYELAKQCLLENELTNRILDAGCGIGYGSFMLADSVANIDSVELSADAHKNYLAYFSKPNINFMCEDIFEAKLQKQYDAIICFEFLEHIEQAEDVVRLFSKLTEVLISSVPNEEVRPHKQEPVNPHHFRHYTPKEYENLLARGGFNISQIWNQASGEEPGFREGPNGKFMVSISTK